MGGALQELLARAWVSPAVAALGGAAGLAWAAASVALASHCKRRRAWRTGDSRKLFHFLIFAAAVFVACGVAALAGLAARGGAAAPHGGDNLVLQLAGSGGALWLLTP